MIIDGRGCEKSLWAASASVDDLDVCHNSHCLPRLPLPLSSDVN